jgi:plastocyanin
MKTILNDARGVVTRFAVLSAVTAGALLSIPLGTMIASQVAWAQDTKKEITIDNFTFSPPTLTIPVGTTVTWVNHDDIPHSVVAKNKEFRSKALDTDDSYSFTFASAGSFDYFCGLHPHMVGKVVVTQ